MDREISNAIADSADICSPVNEDVDIHYRPSALEISDSLVSSTNPEQNVTVEELTNSTTSQLNSESLEREANVRESNVDLQLTCDDRDTVFNNAVHNVSEAESLDNETSCSFNRTINSEDIPVSRFEEDIEYHDSELYLSTNESSREMSYLGGTTKAHSSDDDLKNIHSFPVVGDPPPNITTNSSSSAHEEISKLSICNVSSHVDTTMPASVSDDDESCFEDLHSGIENVKLSNQNSETNKLSQQINPSIMTRTTESSTVIQGITSPVMTQFKDKPEDNQISNKPEVSKLNNTQEVKSVAIQEICNVTGIQFSDMGKLLLSQNRDIHKSDITTDGKELSQTEKKVGLSHITETGLLNQNLEMTALSKSVNSEELDKIIDTQEKSQMKEIQKRHKSTDSNELFSQDVEQSSKSEYNQTSCPQVGNQSSSTPLLSLIVDTSQLGGVDTSNLLAAGKSILQDIETSEVQATDTPKLQSNLVSTPHQITNTPEDSIDNHQSQVTDTPDHTVSSQLQVIDTTNLFIATSQSQITDTSDPLDTLLLKDSDTPDPIEMPQLHITDTSNCINMDIPQSLGADIPDTIDISQPQVTNASNPHTINLQHLNKCESMKAIKSLDTQVLSQIHNTSESKTAVRQESKQFKMNVDLKITENSDHCLVSGPNLNIITNIQLANKVTVSADSNHITIKPDSNCDINMSEVKEIGNIEVKESQKSDEVTNKLLSFTSEIPDLNQTIRLNQTSEIKEKNLKSAADSTIEPVTTTHLNKISMKFDNFDLPACTQKDNLHSYSSQLDSTASNSFDHGTHDYHKISNKSDIRISEAAQFSTEEAESPSSSTDVKSSLIKNSDGSSVADTGSEHALRYACAEDSVKSDGIFMDNLHTVSESQCGLHTEEDFVSNSESLYSNLDLDDNHMEVGEYTTVETTERDDVRFSENNSVDFESNSEDSSLVTTSNSFVHQVSQIVESDSTSESTDDILSNSVKNDASKHSLEGELTLDRTSELSSTNQGEHESVNQECNIHNDFEDDSKKSTEFKKPENELLSSNIDVKKTENISATFSGNVDTSVSKSGLEIFHDNFEKDKNVNICKYEKFGKDTSNSDTSEKDTITSDNLDNVIESDKHNKCTLYLDKLEDKNDYNSTNSSSLVDIENVAINSPKEDDKDVVEDLNMAQDKAEFNLALPVSSLKEEIIDDSIQEVTPKEEISIKNEDDINKKVNENNISAILESNAFEIVSKSNIFIKEEVNEILPNLVKNKVEQQQLASEFLDVKEEFMIEENFDWDCYLEKTNSEAAPPTAFLHVERSLETGVQKNQSLEVLSESKTEENGDSEKWQSFWPAKVVAVCGNLLRLRYLGTTTSKSATSLLEFWCDLSSSKIKPVGWSSDHQIPMNLPPVFEDLPLLLDNQSLQNLDAVPEEVFSSTKREVHNRISEGCFLEVMELKTPYEGRIMRVLQNVGGRLLLTDCRSSADSVEYNPFWIFFLDKRVKPLGWIKEQREPFRYFTRDADEFLNKAGQKSPEKSLSFLLSFSSPIVKHSLQPGLYLEAIHPATLQSIHPTTVSRVLDDVYFELTIDDYKWITTIDDPLIMPCGYSDDMCLDLVPPAGNRGQFFWESYLITVEGIRVSGDMFVQYTTASDLGFEEGHKLEIACPMDQNKICIATIERVLQHILLLKLDSNPEYMFFRAISSTDLFPVGWAQSHSWSLAVPSWYAHRSRNSSVSQIEEQMKSPLEKKYLSTCTRESFWSNYTSVFCPRLYINHCCCPGPYLSKNKVAKMSQSVGPGPVPLVLQDVISMTINSAYIPTRVLRELQHLPKLNPSWQSILTKAKFKRHILKATVNIPSDGRDVINFLTEFSRILMCCPNLWSCENVGENCSHLCNKQSSSLISNGSGALRKGVRCTFRRKKGGKKRLFYPIKPSATNQDENTEEFCDPDEGEEGDDLISESEGESRPSSPAAAEVRKIKPSKRILSSLEITMNDSRGVDVKERTTKRSRGEFDVPEVKSEEEPLFSNRKRARVEEVEKGVVQNAIYGLETAVVHSDPYEWSISDVEQYIASQPDISHHAAKLKEQEVDGPALLLLNLPSLVHHLGLPHHVAVNLAQHICKVKMAYFTYYSNERNGTR